MSIHQPKKKIEAFIEEINNAKTKEELQAILKRLETFARLYPDEKNLYVLAFLYKRLEKYGKALDILKNLKSYSAKFLEAQILKIIKKYTESYKLFNEIENIAPNEEEKMRIAIEKLDALMAMGKFDEMKEIYEKYGEKLLFFADKIGVFGAVRYINRQIKQYKEGTEILNKDAELKQIKNEIEEIAAKYFEYFRIYPMVISYYDGEGKDFTFYISFQEKPDKKIEKSFRIEVMEKVAFKHPDRDFYISIKFPRTGEKSVDYS